MPHIRPACTPCTKGTKHRYPSWTQECSRSCETLRPPCHPRQTTHPRRCQVRFCMPLPLSNHVFSYLSPSLPTFVQAIRSFQGPQVREGSWSPTQQRFQGQEPLLSLVQQGQIAVLEWLSCCFCDPFGWSVLSYHPPSTADLCQKSFGRCHFILWAALVALHADVAC